MKTRIAALLTTVVFLAPATSTAGPILPGGWEPIGTTKVDGAIFWEGEGADCVDCDHATLITSFGPIDYMYSEAMGFTYFHVTRPPNGRGSAGRPEGSGSRPTFIEHVPFAGHPSTPDEKGLPGELLPPFPLDAAEAWSEIGGVTGVGLGQSNVGSTSQHVGAASHQERSDAPGQILQVPEPSMALLLGIGVIALRARRFGH